MCLTGKLLFYREIHLIPFIRSPQSPHCKYYIIILYIFISREFSLEKLLKIFSSLYHLFNLSKKVHLKSEIIIYIPHLFDLPGRAQIGETTDTLNRLEGDLTIVQDSNSEASKELSALEREAKELNLTSEQLHHQLDVLKNSNFLGEKRGRIDPHYSSTLTVT